MKTISTGHLVLAAVLVLAAAPVRGATAEDEAEALIKEGVRLRSHDQSTLALPQFEKAYQTFRSPRTAGQLGLCELELGSFAEAERHLGEALATPAHPWIAKNKATLKSSLEKARVNVGELVLTLTPPAADVSLNGKQVERALPGAPIRVAKGSVDLEVRAPGFAPTRETITIVGGKREQRTYVLAPEPPPVVAAPVPGVAPEPGPAISLAAPPPEAGAQRTKRLAAWITGGAAVGALVFGTVEAFSAASRRDAFNDHTSVVGGVAYHDCGTANLSPACMSLKDDDDLALTFTVIGFAVTGALAATSSVLYVLSSPGHGGAERDGGVRALACVPDPVARGFGCSLRF